MEKLTGITTAFRAEKNEEKNGVELYFEAIPTAKERETLKKQGYRWHNVKKCWYKKITATASTTKTKTKHSLKVGDILASSWGYEQTNNSFYRVEALKGATMVTVREVYLGIKESEDISGMSEDRIYDVNNWEYARDSKEITRKVKNYYQDNRPEGDSIDIESFETAHKYTGQKMYCSWYY